MTHAIPKRRLGSEGLEVSALGLGCMGMSEFYGPTEELTNLEVLHHALNSGVNFFDTADMYGVGRNELLLAQVLKSRRNEMVLATKFGNVRTSTGEFVRIDGTPEYVKAACNGSLQRLGIECIDLYYQHRVDPNVPIEDTVGAMKLLVEAGKVRYIGLSEASGDTLRRAHRVHPISALQSEYSLWTRDVEHDALPACRELGIGFVAYSPLGRGFLTGALKRIDDLAPDDRRRQHPRFKVQNFEINRRLVEEVTQIAQTKNCSPAQLALAWLLNQGNDIVPIPGTRKVERLNENVAATSVRLSNEDLERIRNVLAHAPIAGTRYPEAQMGSLNR